MVLNWYLFERITLGANNFNIVNNLFGKLSGMFSGYGQTSAVVSDVMYAVEKHMENTQHMDHALDRLQEWDAGGKPASAIVTCLCKCVH